MEYIIVSAAALIASALTLFSGFGLGTLLMPVVAVFFPVEVAIAMTAMVHLANNLFKVGLLGRKADKPVLMRFGIPAVIAAFAGAFLLTWLTDLPPVFTYDALGRSIQVSPLKLIVGIVILAFVLLELWPRFANLAFEKRHLPYGGALSGFFGGLSGHQGAFRSMFLLKAGLNTEAFVATGVMIAVMVDVARMSVYGWDIVARHGVPDWPLVALASLSAFLGAYAGAKLLKKVTIRFVQIVVSVLLVVIGVGLIAGIL